MPTDDNQPPVAQSRWPLYLSLALIAALLLAYALIPPFQSEVNQGAEVLASGDQDRVSEWVEQYGAPLGFRTVQTSPPSCSPASQSRVAGGALSAIQPTIAGVS